MIMIKNWTAKRSGGRITIEGTTYSEGLGTDKSIKVANVDTIAKPNHLGQTVATDKDGNKFALI